MECSYGRWVLKIKNKKKEKTQDELESELNVIVPPDPIHPSILNYFKQKILVVTDKKELYEQNQAPIQETEQPEDSTTASIKSMVKIARILDCKKKYKLADKFTNILGKYNV